MKFSQTLRIRKVPAQLSKMRRVVAECEFEEDSYEEDGNHHCDGGSARRCRCRSTDQGRSARLGLGPRHRAWHRRRRSRRRSGGQHLARLCLWAGLRLLRPRLRLRAALLSSSLLRRSVRLLRRTALLSPPLLAPSPLVIDQADRGSGPVLARRAASSRSPAADARAPWRRAIAQWRARRHTRQAMVFYCFGAGAATGGVLFFAATGAFGAAVGGLIGA